MLPFLEPKKLSSVIVANRKPSGAIVPDKEEGDEDSALMSAAEDLISAVHSKSASSVAAALRAAFDICGSGEEPQGSSLFDSGGE